MPGHNWKQLNGQEKSFFHLSQVMFISNIYICYMQLANVYSNASLEETLSIWPWTITT